MAIKILKQWAMYEIYVREKCKWESERANRSSG